MKCRCLEHILRDAMHTLGAKREKERCVGELRKYELECIKEGE
jgi:hypothetical protein